MISEDNYGSVIKDIVSIHQVFHTIDYLFNFILIEIKSRWVKQCFIID